MVSQCALDDRRPSRDSYPMIRAGLFRKTSHAPTLRRTISLKSSEVTGYSIITAVRSSSLWSLVRGALMPGAHVVKVSKTESGCFAVRACRPACAHSGESGPISIILTPTTRISGPSHSLRGQVSTSLWLDYQRCTTRADQSLAKPSSRLEQYLVTERKT